jgi:hypothetical protein
VGDSGKLNRHFFCGRCGSSLYTRPEILPDIVCIKAGGLNGGLKGIGDGEVEVEWYAKDRSNYMLPQQSLRQENTLSEGDIEKLQQVLVHVAG